MGAKPNPRQDNLNKEGGNWIVVPRPRDVTGVLVFKEILLSIIGGDLDRSVNGVVLSVKQKDIITQIWLPSTKLRKRERVHAKAHEALAQHCKQLLCAEGGACKASIEWTWRAHPTATLGENDVRSGEPPSLGGDDPQPRGDRGMCGECIGTAKQSCGIQ